MRKRMIMGVAAAVAATSLGVAAPARAQDCLSNRLPLPPESGTVYLDNGQLRINPNGVQGDIDQYVAYATERAVDFYWCVVELVPPQVWCIANNAVGIATNPDRYVYQENGEIVVDYRRLANDLATCSV